MKCACRGRNKLIGDGALPEIIFLISSFLGSKPKALMATFNSLASIVPEESRERKSTVSIWQLVGGDTNHIPAHCIQYY